MSELKTAVMAPEDVDAVHEIEKVSLREAWTKEALFKDLTENPCARYLVLKEDGVPVAYAGAWFVIDEGHITNVAVRPDKRRMGYGQKIVSDMMQLAADTGMGYLTLEVRASNQAARGLYRKLGFVELGKRKRYYEDNGEDALILVCDKLPEANPENDPFLQHEG